MTTDGKRSVAVPPAAQVYSAPADVPALDGRPAMLRIARGCAAVAAILALICLSGWVFDVPTLERFASGWATMKINTAVAIVLLAAAGGLGGRIRVVASALGGALMALVVAEYPSGMSLGIDQLIANDPSPISYPGRTSLAAALCLLLLAVTQLLDATGRRLWAEALSTVALAVGALTVVGYFYNVRSLYALGPFQSIALPTACAIVLLGVMSLARVRNGALQWAVFAADPGASLVRRLLPLALIGVPMMGRACVGLDEVGWINGTATIGLLVVLCSLAVVFVSAIAASHLHRLDRHRAQTLEDLQHLKTTLQQQVVERSNQVQLRRDEIAVLEDRQRIAADLHDIVIQRLFAAGMFLQGASDGTLDPDARRRVDAAVESMDTAIRDLRNSIFELGGAGVPTVDLASELDAVCVESSRVLGFVPELTVDDPDEEAERVREDLLAVLREALANVARHALASAVVVTLRTGHGLIGLTVADNGRGMLEAPHSSGTRNMADRARRHGGDCVWTPLQPNGTRVWWYVAGVPAVPVAHEPSAAERQRAVRPPASELQPATERQVSLEKSAVGFLRLRLFGAATDRRGVLGDA